MNITVNSQVLANELRAINRVVPSKPAFPILGHVKLRAAEGQLSFMATNLDQAISTSCAAVITEPGEMTLPVAALLNMLERIPNADVMLSTGGHIATGTFRSRLSALPAGDFPALPQPNGEPATALPSHIFHHLMERAHYAVSEKETKHVLRGALLSLSNNVIALVATDGQRLSVCTAAKAEGAADEIVIPTKTMEVLLDQPITGEVRYSRNNQHLFFNYGNRLISSRTIDGSFPKYQRIIPRANEHVAQMNRAQLISALQRVGVVSESLMMTFYENTLEFSSRSAEIGDANETLSIQYGGPEIKVTVRWKLVLDFLEHATEAVVTIALKDNLSPLLLTDGPDFINVVMVMR